MTVALQPRLRPRAGQGGSIPRLPSPKGRPGQLWAGNRMPQTGGLPC